MPSWFINVFIMLLEKVLSSDLIDEQKKAIIEKLRAKAADTESPIDDFLVDLFAQILGVE